MPRRTLAARLRRRRGTLVLIALVVLAIATSAALRLGGQERPVPEAAELAAVTPAAAVQRVNLIECDPLEDPAPAAAPVSR